jgi:CDP-diacylglycerol--glycerol-3-phosphate 3-phosphatidyltransferase/cardiolipin synthase
MVGFLLCRDFLVSGLRMAAFQQKFEVEVSWFGKFKTLLLDTAIVCLMINERLWDIPFRAIGMLTLWLSLILSLYSAWLYIRVFAKGMVQPQP